MKPDTTEFVNFGDIARGQLHQQCQYASLYVGGKAGYPDLGIGLRFREHGKPVSSSDDYHSLEIHRDDVPVFLERVAEYRKKNGMTPEEYALALIKDIVLLLKKSGKDLPSQLELKELFLKQNAKVSEALKGLTREQFTWVAVEYEKWFKEQS